MRTYSEFLEDHRRHAIWTADGGLMETEQGDRVLTIDVLAYLDVDDMERDHDNTLAIARETVIDDSAEVAVEAKRCIAGFLASGDVVAD